jgi:hypothetical protein
MAEYLVNLNNGKTDEKAAFRLVGKLLNQSGVLEATGLTVSATTPTPDMTVKVSGSVASDNVVFITATGDTYHGWNTAQYAVTILSNATGATKYDAIVAYADTAAGSTTANNPGGLKFIAVRSSGAGVATAADITASAVGTKPYLRLADVTVANGVSSINSGNIVDTRPKASVGTNLIATSAVQTNAITKATSFAWDVGATALTTTSSGYVQIGTFSGALTTLSPTTCTLLVTMDCTSAYVNGGNGRVGIDIDGQASEICCTFPNTSGLHVAGSQVIALALTAGAHTLKPIFLNTAGPSSTTTINTFGAIKVSVVELQR